METIKVKGDGPEIFSLTTVLSLLSTVAILLAAYLASRTFLPNAATSKTRFLFIWHAFDALIHFILEGSFLYNCFFEYTSSPASHPVSAYLPPNIYFLGRTDRIYGAEHGHSPFSALWREYAKADARWGGSDVTIISLELLTVFVAGPLAAYICSCLRTGQEGKAWFWMIVVATGELYGGFMTFVPEWLTGSPNLDTSNWMYKWLYLFFFNTLWVWIPFWILWEGYGSVVRGVQARATVELKKTR
ncbi:Emopamil-binding protein [Polychaeton citri CBS 116435]|uniref:Emopamil-binding protein n=1 Tax=Polychaeton citri CBS 116435 TaxID=1314669 RepID=A0A9P4Q1J4_9PEZI|nr:Emopamil-binding protein [Polychaeton citri CBS 116435]